MAVMRWPKDGLDGLAAEELAPLRAEHQRLLRASGEAKLAVDRLRGPARQQAERDDTAAYAAALRAGDKDPGAVNVQRVAAELAAAERSLAGHQLAVKNVWADVQRQVTERGEAYAADLSDMAWQDRDRALRALTDLEAAATRMVAHMDAARWCRGGKSMTRTLLPKVGGTEAKAVGMADALAQVAAALESYGTGPAVEEDLALLGLDVEDEPDDD